jgi:hypothetical protein
MWASQLNNEFSLLKDLKSSLSNSSSYGTPQDLLKQDENEPGLFAQINNKIIQDPILKQKLSDYILSNPNDKKIRQNLKIIRKVLLSKLNDIAPAEHQIFTEFLKHVSSPKIAKKARISKEQVTKIRSLLVYNSDNIGNLISGISKKFKEKFQSRLRESETERTFRQKSNLVAPDNLEVDYLVNQMFYKGELTQNMSDTEMGSKILSYVQNNYEYKADSLKKDYWQNTEETIESKSGDCEDLAILQASLLMNALKKKGHTNSQISNMVRLSAGYLRDLKGNKFGHVIVKLNVQKGSKVETLVLDATSTKPAFALNKISFQELFEFNNKTFIKYSKISDDFQTAVRASNLSVINFTDPSSIISRINRHVVNLNGGINPDDPSNRITGLLKQPIDLPKLNSQMGLGTIDFNSFVDILKKYNACAATTNQTQRLLDIKWASKKIFQALLSYDIIKADVNATVRKRNEDGKLVDKDDNVITNSEETPARETFQGSLTDYCETETTVNNLVRNSDFSSVLETYGRFSDEDTKSNASDAIYQLLYTGLNHGLGEGNNSKEFKFFTIDKKSIGAGIDALTTTLHTKADSDADPDGSKSNLFDYVNDVRRQVNMITMLFHVGNSYAEYVNQAGRDIHDSIYNEYEKSQVQRERQKQDKQKSKFTESMNKFQERQSSSIQDAAEQIFNFINSINKANCEKSRYEIEGFLRETDSMEEIGMALREFDVNISNGVFTAIDTVISIFMGVTSEIFDQITGAISYIRALLHRKISEVECEVFANNAAARAEFSELMGEGVKLWRSRKGDIDTPDEQYDDMMSKIDNSNYKNSHLYWGKDLVRRMDGNEEVEEQRRNPLNLRKTKTLKFTNIEGENLKNVADIFANNEASGFDAAFPDSVKEPVRLLGYIPEVYANNARETAANENAVFRPLTSTKVRDNVLSGALFSTARGKTGYGAFIDYNMERQMLSREYLMEYQNYLRVVLLIKNALFEHKKAVAKEISGMQDTTSTAAYVKASETAFDVELSKQSMAFDALHNTAVMLTDTMNALQKNRLNVYSTAYKMAARITRTAAQLTLFLTTSGTAPPAAATMAAAQTPPLLPGTPPVPNPLYPPNVEGWANYLKTVSNAIPTAAIAIVEQIAEYEVEQWIEDWYYPELMQHDSWRFSPKATDYMLSQATEEITSSYLPEMNKRYFGTQDTGDGQKELTNKVLAQGELMTYLMKGREDLNRLLTAAEKSYTDKDSVESMSDSRYSENEFYADNNSNFYYFGHSGHGREMDVEDMQFMGEIAGDAIGWPYYRSWEATSDGSPDIVSMIMSEAGVDFDIPSSAPNSGELTAVAAANSENTGDGTVYVRGQVTADKIETFLADESITVSSTGIDTDLSTADVTAIYNLLLSNDVLDDHNQNRLSSDFDTNPDNITAMQTRLHEDLGDDYDTYAPQIYNVLIRINSELSISRNSLLENASSIALDTDYGNANADQIMTALQNKNWITITAPYGTNIGKVRTDKVSLLEDEDQMQATIARIQIALIAERNSGTITHLSEDNIINASQGIYTALQQAAGISATSTDPGMAGGNNTDPLSDANEQLVDNTVLTPFRGNDDTYRLTQKPPEFILNRLDGQFAIDGLKMAQKIEDANEEHRKIRVMLSILKAKYEAMGNIFSEMFNTSNTNQFAKFDRAVNAVLAFENEGLNALKAEVNTSLSALKQLGSKMQQINAACWKYFDTTARQVLTLVDTYFLPPVPIMNRQNWVGKYAFSAVELAYDSLQFFRENVFGAFAPFYSKEYLRQRERLYNNDPNAYSDADLKALTKGAWSNETFTRDKALELLGAPSSGNTDRYSFYTNVPTGQTLGGVPITKYVRTTEKEIEVRDMMRETYIDETSYLKNSLLKAENPDLYVNRVTEDMAPWFNLDEREKENIFKLYGGDVERNSSGDVKEVDSDGDYNDTFALEEADGLGFTQVSYTNVIRAQENLNRFSTLRTMYLMIIQSLYEAKQNTLQQMFGTRSAAGILSSTMEIVEEYNSAQFEALNNVVQEFVERSDAYNAYHQAEINVGVELVTLVGSAAAFYAVDHFGQGSYLNDLLKGAGGREAVQSLFKAIFNSVLGIIGLYTLHKPTKTDGMGLTDSESKQNQKLDEEDENLKKKEDSLAQKEKEGTLTKKEKRKLKRIRSRRQALSIDRTQQNWKQESNYGIDTSSAIKVSAGGRVILNKAVAIKAKQKLTRKFRAIKMQKEVSNALNDAIQDSAAEIGGVQAAKAWKGIMSILSRFKSSELAAVGSVISGLEARVAAINRSVKRIQEGLGGVISFAATAIKVKKDRKYNKVINEEKKGRQEKAAKAGVHAKAIKKTKAEKKARKSRSRLNTFSNVFGDLLKEAVQEAFSSLLVSQISDMSFEGGFAGEDALNEDAGDAMNTDAMASGQDTAAANDRADDAVSGMGVAGLQALEDATLMSDIAGATFAAKKQHFANQGSLYHNLAGKIMSTVKGIVKKKQAKKIKKQLKAQTKALMEKMALEDPDKVMDESGTTVGEMMAEEAKARIREQKALNPNYEPTDQDRKLLRSFYENQSKKTIAKLQNRLQAAGLSSPELAQEIEALGQSIAAAGSSDSPDQIMQQVEQKKAAILKQAREQIREMEQAESEGAATAASDPATPVPQPSSREVNLSISRSGILETSDTATAEQSEVLFLRGANGEVIKINADKKLAKQIKKAYQADGDVSPAEARRRKALKDQLASKLGLGGLTAVALDASILDGITIRDGDASDPTARRELTADKALGASKLWKTEKGERSQLMDALQERGVLAGIDDEGERTSKIQEAIRATGMVLDDAQVKALGDSINEQITSRTTSSAASIQHVGPAQVSTTAKGRMAATKEALGALDELGEIVEAQDIFEREISLSSESADMSQVKDILADTNPDLDLSQKGNLVKGLTSNINSMRGSVITAENLQKLNPGLSSAEAEKVVAKMRELKLIDENGIGTKNWNSRSKLRQLSSALEESGIGMDPGTLKAMLQTQDSNRTAISNALKVLGISAPKDATVEALLALSTSKSAQLRVSALGAISTTGGPKYRSQELQEEAAAVKELAAQEGLSPEQQELATGLSDQVSKSKASRLKSRKEMATGALGRAKAIREFGISKSGIAKLIARDHAVQTLRDSEELKKEQAKIEKDQEQQSKLKENSGFIRFAKAMGKLLGGVALATAAIAGSIASLPVAVVVGSIALVAGIRFAIKKATKAKTSSEVFQKKLDKETANQDKQKKLTKQRRRKYAAGGTAVAALAVAGVFAPIVAIGGGAVMLTAGALYLLYKGVKKGGKALNKKLNPPKPVADPILDAIRDIMPGESISFQDRLGQQSRTYQSAKLQELSASRWSKRIPRKQQAEAVEKATSEIMKELEKPGGEANVAEYLAKLSKDPSSRAFAAAILKNLNGSKHGVRALSAKNKALDKILESLNDLASSDPTQKKAIRKLLFSASSDSKNTESQNFLTFLSKSSIGTQLLSQVSEGQELSRDEEANIENMPDSNILDLTSSLLSEKGKLSAIIGQGAAIPPAQLTQELTTLLTLEKEEEEDTPKFRSLGELKTFLAENTSYENGKAVLSAEAMQILKDETINIAIQIMEGILSSSSQKGEALEILGMLESLSSSESGTPSDIIEEIGVILSGIETDDGASDLEKIKINRMKEKLQETRHPTKGTKRFLSALTGDGSAQRLSAVSARSAESKRLVSKLHIQEKLKELQRLALADPAALAKELSGNDELRRAFADLVERDLAGSNPEDWSDPVKQPISIQILMKLAQENQTDETFIKTLSSSLRAQITKKRRVDIKKVAQVFEHKKTKASRLGEMLESAAPLAISGWLQPMIKENGQIDQNQLKKHFHNLIARVGDSDTARAQFVDLVSAYPQAAATLINQSHSDSPILQTLGTTSFDAIRRTGQEGELKPAERRQLANAAKYLKLVQGKLGSTISSELTRIASQLGTSLTGADGDTITAEQAQLIEIEVDRELARLDRMEYGTTTDSRMAEETLQELERLTDLEAKSIRSQGMLTTLEASPITFSDAEERELNAAIVEKSLAEGAPGTPGRLGELQTELAAARIALPGLETQRTALTAKQEKLAQASALLDEIHGDPDAPETAARLATLAHLGGDLGLTNADGTPFATSAGTPLAPAEITAAKLGELLDTARAETAAQEAENTALTAEQAKIPNLSSELLRLTTRLPELEARITALTDKKSESATYKATLASVQADLQTAKQDYDQLKAELMVLEYRQNPLEELEREQRSEQARLGSVTEADGTPKGDILIAQAEIRTKLNEVTAQLATGGLSATETTTLERAKASYEKMLQDPPNLDAINQRIQEPISAGERQSLIKLRSYVEPKTKLAAIGKAMAIKARAGSPETKARQVPLTAKQIKLRESLIQVKALCQSFRETVTVQLSGIEPEKPTAAAGLRHFVDRLGFSGAAAFSVVESGGETSLQPAGDQLAGTEAKKYLKENLPGQMRSVVRDMARLQRKMAGIVGDTPEKEKLQNQINDLKELHTKLSNLQRLLTNPDQDLAEFPGKDLFAEALSSTYDRDLVGSRVFEALEGIRQASSNSEVKPKLGILRSGIDDGLRSTARLLENTSLTAEEKTKLETQQEALQDLKELIDPAATLFIEISTRQAQPAASTAIADLATFAHDARENPGLHSRLGNLEALAFVASQVTTATSTGERAAFAKLAPQVVASYLSEADADQISSFMEGDNAGDIIQAVLTSKDVPYSQKLAMVNTILEKHGDSIDTDQATSILLGLNSAMQTPSRQSTETVAELRKLEAAVLSQAKTLASKAAENISEELTALADLPEGSGEITTKRAAIANQLTTILSLASRQEQNNTSADQRIDLSKVRSTLIELVKGSELETALTTNPDFKEANLETLAKILEHADFQTASKLTEPQIKSLQKELKTMQTIQAANKELAKYSSSDATTPSKIAKLSLAELQKPEHKALLSSLLTILENPGLAASLKQTQPVIYQKMMLLAGAEASNPTIDSGSDLGKILNHFAHQDLNPASGNPNPDLELVKSETVRSACELYLSSPAKSGATALSALHQEGAHLATDLTSEEALTARVEQLSTLRSTIEFLCPDGDYSKYLSMAPPSENPRISASTFVALVGDKSQALFDKLTDPASPFISADGQLQGTPDEVEHVISDFLKQNGSTPAAAASQASAFVNSLVRLPALSTQIATDMRDIRAQLQPSSRVASASATTADTAGFSKMLSQVIHDQKSKVKRTFGQLGSEAKALRKTALKHGATYTTHLNRMRSILFSDKEVILALLEETGETDSEKLLEKLTAQDVPEHQQLANMLELLNKLTEAADKKSEQGKLELNNAKREITAALMFEVLGKGKSLEGMSEQAIVTLLSTLSDNADELIPGDSGNEIFNQFKKLLQDPSKKQVLRDLILKHSAKLPNNGKDLLSKLGVMTIETGAIDTATDLLQSDRAPAFASIELATQVLEHSIGKSDAEPDGTQPTNIDDVLEIIRNPKLNEAQKKSLLENLPLFKELTAGTPPSHVVNKFASIFIALGADRTDLSKLSPEQRALLDIAEAKFGKPTSVPKILDIRALITEEALIIGDEATSANPLELPDLALPEGTNRDASIFRAKAQLNLLAKATMFGSSKLSKSSQQKLAEAFKKAAADPKQLNTLLPGFLANPTNRAAFKLLLENNPDFRQTLEDHVLSKDCELPTQTLKRLMFVNGKTTVFGKRILGSIPKSRSINDIKNSSLRQLIVTSKPRFVRSLGKDELSQVIAQAKTEGSFSKIKDQLKHNPHFKEIIKEEMQGLYALTGNERADKASEIVELLNTLADSPARMHEQILSIVQTSISEIMASTATPAKKGSQIAIIITDLLGSPEFLPDTKMRTILGDIIPKALESVSEDAETLKYTAQSLAPVVEMKSYNPDDATRLEGLSKDVRVTIRKELVDHPGLLSATQLLSVISNLDSEGTESVPQDYADKLATAISNLSTAEEKEAFLSKLNNLSHKNTALFFDIMQKLPPGTRTEIGSLPAKVANGAIVIPAGSELTDLFDHRASVPTVSAEDLIVQVTSDGIPRDQRHVQVTEEGLELASDALEAIQTEGNELVLASLLTKIADNPDARALFLEGLNQEGISITDSFLGENMQFFLDNLLTNPLSDREHRAANSLSEKLYDSFTQSPKTFSKKTTAKEYKKYVRDLEVLLKMPGITHSQRKNIMRLMGKTVSSIPDKKMGSFLQQLTTSSMSKEMQDSVIKTLMKDKGNQVVVLKHLQTLYKASPQNANAKKLYFKHFANLLNNRDERLGPYSPRKAMIESFVTDSLKEGGEDDFIELFNAGLNPTGKQHLLGTMIEMDKSNRFIPFSAKLPEQVVALLEKTTEAESSKLALPPQFQQPTATAFLADFISSRRTDSINRTKRFFTSLTRIGQFKMPALEEAIPSGNAKQVLNKLLEQGYLAAKKDGHYVTTPKFDPTQPLEIDGLSEEDCQKAKEFLSTQQKKLTQVLDAVVSFAPDMAAPQQSFAFGKDEKNTNRQITLLEFTQGVTDHLKTRVARKRTGARATTFEKLLLQTLRTKKKALPGAWSQVRTSITPEDILGITRDKSASSTAKALLKSAQRLHRKEGKDYKPQELSAPRKRALIQELAAETKEHEDLSPETLDTIGSSLTDLAVAKEKLLQYKSAQTIDRLQTERTILASVKKQLQKRPVSVAELKKLRTQIESSDFVNLKLETSINNLIKATQALESSSSVENQAKLDNEMQNIMANLTNAKVEIDESLSMFYLEAPALFETMSRFHDDTALPGDLKKENIQQLQTDIRSLIRTTTGTTTEEAIANLVLDNNPLEVLFAIQSIDARFPGEIDKKGTIEAIKQIASKQSLSLAEFMIQQVKAENPGISIVDLKVNLQACLTAFELDGTVPDAAKDLKKAFKELEENITGISDLEDPVEVTEETLKSRGKMLHTLFTSPSGQLNKPELKSYLQSIGIESPSDTLMDQLEREHNVYTILNGTSTQAREIVKGLDLSSADSLFATDDSALKTKFKKKAKTFLPPIIIQGSFDEFAETKDLVPLLTSIQDVLSHVAEED